MPSSIFVYDPTINDPLSKVRGIGRYLQILKENFDKKWIFTDKLKIENLKFKTFINPFFNFLKPPLTMRRVAEKQIAIIHDLIPFKYPNRFPTGIKGKINIFLNQLALNNYDLIVTDSQASKKDIIEILGIDEKKIKVIYPCLPKIFSNKLPANNYELKTNNYCLYVGDSTWNKNLVNLAKAVKTINVSCVFAGKVFEKDSINSVKNLESGSINKWQLEFKEFIKETENDKRFIFKGFLPDKELIGYYKNAKCNILVSRDEGFGFTFLESASQNCPSVLSDIPILKEISNKQGVILTNPGNPNSIADAIGEIFFNKNIRTSLGLAAKERVNFFSGEKFKKSWSDIIY